jgi:amidohydrolase
LLDPIAPAESTIREMTATLSNRIACLRDEMSAWRRDLHSHPETAFEEHRTSALIAAKLQEFGIEVHRGLAGTGLVGTLRAGSGARAIGLRADMDALRIHEKNRFDYVSKIDGKMHACGHDGHIAMLLGAAKYLAEVRDFDGIVHFIFQPAEENEGGGRVMVEQGLFEKFPVEAVFALHNWPGLAVGQFGVRVGPIMAAFDVFEIEIHGVGCHAAMPQQGRDPIVCAANVVNALQGVVAREVDPLEAAVISVTQVHAGDSWNVIPDTVTLRGTVRSFQPRVQDMLEASLRRVVDGVCRGHRCSAAVTYDRRYPSTINTRREVQLSVAAMIDVVGAENVETDASPSMAAEDFAFLLQKRPGAYVFIGNGKDTPPLHSPHYDFNDEILTIGASYLACIARRALAQADFNSEDRND